jgi:hypothetical protein
MPHTERTRFRRIAGAIWLPSWRLRGGTIAMHHVAAIYKGGAALWSLVICLHFIKVSRNQPSVPQLLS